MVLEEEDDNNENMAEGEEGGDEGIWMDGEDEPPDDLRYNGEGKKNRCMNREHAEDSFEASNCNTGKVRSKSRNEIAQSTKPINLSQTAHPQFRALDLRHESDVHSRPGANQRKISSRAHWRQLYSQHQKRDSVTQHWWKNSSETALDDDQRRLLEDLTGLD